MRFTLIERVGKKLDKFRFEYLDQNDQNKWEEKSLASKMRPLPDLPIAFDNLSQTVTKLEELPDSYKDRIVVTGVILKYTGKEQVLGCRIRAYRKLKNSESPSKILTAYKKSGDADTSLLMSPYCRQLIKELCDAAVDYCNGKRHQVEMQFEKAA